MELVVVRIAGSWVILVQGRKWGRYDYEIDAVEAALRMAEILALQHPNVHVVVQDRFGELRPVDGHTPI